MKKLQTSKRRWARLLGAMVVVILTTATATFVTFGFVQTRIKPPSLPVKPDSGPALQRTMAGEWTGDVSLTGTSAVKLYVKKVSRNEGLIATFVTVPLDSVGLPSTLATHKQIDVDFQIVRDAGRIAFQGQFRNGKGSGVWTLTSDPAYQAAMERRGHENLKDSYLFLATTEDVTEKYIDDLKSLGFDNLSFIELIDAAGNGVTAEFIGRVRSRGYPNASLKEIVQLRVHNIMK